MKFFLAAFLILQFFSDILSFEISPVLKRPPLKHLRGSRNLELDAMGTFAGAAGASAALVFLASGNKNKLLDQLQRLKFADNLESSENQTQFSNRGTMLGDLKNLATGSSEQLDGIEVECSGIIEEIKSEINRSSRLQNARILKVMGNSKI